MAGSLDGTSVLNMGKPEKAARCLTDIHGYDEDHLAWL
jgi:hypothetical protein